MPKKNSLDAIEIEVAAEIVEKRRHGHRYDTKKNQTRIARKVRRGERLPPPVPRGRSLADIREMDPESAEFRHRTGQPRKWTPDVDESTLSWRDIIRRDEQRSRNARRAKMRKYEAEVVKAQEIMKTHTNSDDHKIDIFDEERAIAEGILALDDWDDEELVRGFRRNRNGRFGKAPKYIPREIQQEAFRRLVQRGERKMRDAYVRTIENLVDLAYHATSEKVRLEAQKELLNRVVGKVPDTMHVSIEAKPWEGLLADAMVPVSEVPVIDLDVDDEGVAGLPYVDLPDVDPEDLPTPASVPTKATREDHTISHTKGTSPDDSAPLTEPVHAKRRRNTRSPKAKPKASSS